MEIRKKRNISNIIDDKNIVIEELKELKITDINRYNLILETYDLIKKYDNLTKKNLEEIKNNKDKEYGVCFNFAEKFENICKENNLNAFMINGHYIGEDDIELGHAWNCVIIDGKDYYIDISSGIHIKDGTYKGSIDDYFMKTYEELEQIDAERKSKRVIKQEELDKIELKLQKF